LCDCGCEGVVCLPSIGGGGCEDSVNGEVVTEEGGDGGCLEGEGIAVDVDS
jgi:hypothetical protein